MSMMSYSPHPKGCGGIDVIALFATLLLRTLNSITSHLLSPEVFGASPYRVLMSSTTNAEPVKLSAFTVQAWKRQVNTKALDFAAWGILHGTEPYPGFSADPKTIASWNERRSKLLGYIMSTIDETMADTFLQDISTVDVNDMWLRLIELFEPKSAASRTAVLQELMAMRMSSPGNENESFQQYGNRAIALAARLSSLLPPGPSYIPEDVSQVMVPILRPLKDKKSAERTYAVDERIPMAQAAGFAEHYIPSSYTPGYQATTLARELANSIIPIGLPASADALRRTLNLLDIGSNPNAIMEALIAEDALARNTALADGTSAAALSTNDKKKVDRRPNKFTCTHHELLRPCSHRAGEEEGGSQERYHQFT
ncbi:hypothetical protein D9611_009755 [Ephemerocybe angulata]|uniref:Uncharacterized protein n=1 Tax=Ephemerocybe angulata TaxID=980116 RepID=A0A8H5CCZ6_9AGAR|nr:hypothetical protein D9611_009755 [Tulosesus angulatus]